MAATGVLPFVRGVDLSGNDFKVRGSGSGAQPGTQRPGGPAPAGLSGLARPPGAGESRTQPGPGG